MKAKSLSEHNLELPKEDSVFPLGMKNAEITSNKLFPTAPHLARSRIQVTGEETIYKSNEAKDNSISRCLVKQTLDIKLMVPRKPEQLRMKRQRPNILMNKN